MEKGQIPVFCDRKLSPIAPDSLSYSQKMQMAMSSYDCILAMYKGEFDFSNGMHRPEDKMPVPYVLLWVRVADNPDHVSGGAAIYGEDGIWYWAYDGEKDHICKYDVVYWQYMYDEDARRYNSGD